MQFVDMSYSAVSTCMNFNSNKFSYLQRFGNVFPSINDTLLDISNIFITRVFEKHFATCSLKENLFNKIHLD